MKAWKKFQAKYGIKVNKTELYQRACLLARVEPNALQRERWRHKSGRAYSKRTTARKQIIQRIRKYRGLDGSVVFAT